MAHSGWKVDLLTDFKQMAGKKIDRVCFKDGFDLPETIALHFDDSTAALAEAEQGYPSDEPHLILRDHRRFFSLDDFFDFGLITTQEYNEETRRETKRLLENDKRSAAQAEFKERAEYERLKSKYEGKSE